MPYATPSSSTPTSPMLTTHSLGRPGHRRSYSHQHATTASPGGAFTSLRPPARKQKFHINASSSSDSSDNDEDDGPPPPLKLKTPLSPSFGVPFPRSSPLSSPVPGDRESGLLSPLSGLQTHITNLPSPRNSPRTSPRTSPHSSSTSISTQNSAYLAPPKRPQPSRTASSPILLSNGKPLKSSLKGSSSTSNIPVQHPSHPHHQPHHTRPQPTSHQRARSAPSTPWEDDASIPPSPSTAPSTPKNVHFPSLPNDLEHIRVFNKSAKPISFLRRSSDVSRGPTGVIVGEVDSEVGGETETETETDRDNASVKRGAWANNGYLRSWGGLGDSLPQQQQTPGFPFPRVPSPPRDEGKSKEEETQLELELKEGYEVPSSSQSDKLVMLEKVELERKDKDKEELKMLLYVLVKNIAFEKQVYFRFTMDEWATVSEVGGKYVESVRGEDVHRQRQQGKTLGDIISLSSSLHSRSASEPALSSAQETYDRFLITVSLTDYLHLKLENRVMWGVMRYTVPGRGEWWDNNGDRNYRMGWVRRKVAAVPTTPPATRERKEGRSMSAPAAPPSTLPRPALMSPPAYTSPTSAVHPAVLSKPDAHKTEALSTATQNRLSKFSLRNYVAPGSVHRSPKEEQSTVAQLPKPTISVEVPTPEKKVTPPPAPQQQQKGLSLYWPWASSNSTTTTTTNASSNTSTPTPKASEKTTTTNATVANARDSPVVTPGGSATVEVLGSGRKDYFGEVAASTTVSPVTTSITSPPPSLPSTLSPPSSRTSSMSSTTSEAPVPALDHDDSRSTSSATSSSESLDSLMSPSYPRLVVYPDVHDGEYRDDDEFAGFDFVGSLHEHEPTKEGGESGSETEKPQQTISVSVSPSPPSLTSSPLPNPFSPPPLSNAGGAGDSEELYKAFVKQWCFAGSPGKAARDDGVVGLGLKGRLGLEVSS